LEAEYTQLSQTATVTADEIAAANERATKAATELTNAQKRLNKNQTDIDAADTKYTAATAEVKTLVPEVQKAEDALNQLIQKKK
jgi:predicted  nucleic acid-binding Zn-ribbon protein